MCRVKIENKMFQVMNGIAYPVRRAFGACIDPRRKHQPKLGKCLAPPRDHKESRKRKQGFASFGAHEGLGSAGAIGVEEGLARVWVGQALKIGTKPPCPSSIL